MFIMHGGVPDCMKVDRRIPCSLFRYISIIKLFRNWAIILASSVLLPGRFKNFILRQTGAHIHSTAFISPFVLIDPVSPEFITVGRSVFIGWSSRLFAHIVSPSGNELSLSSRHIVLKEGCFIGGFTTIRGGVTVGKNAIVGSDSLVLHDVPAGALAYGTPAKVVCGE
jgi:acetyltransferase-like isoleucine patch superfamily enzyme